MLEHPIEFAGFTFSGSNMGTLFSPSHKTLFISDLHFGKTQHFRKNGVPLSLETIEDNMGNLEFVLQHYHPDECIFLGDLFHSDWNSEWELLISLLEKWSRETTFRLVLGNHDIVAKQISTPDFLNPCHSYVWNDCIQLSHEPVTSNKEPQICGHLHAGYLLKGKGKQALVVKCFYEINNILIMPAFGNLTGKIALNKQMPGGRALGYTKESIFKIAESVKLR